MALASACLAGCTTVPWGAGGAQVVAEAREIRGGLVRELGPDGLARASERLALAVAERWSDAPLPLETVVGGAVHIAWNDLRPEPGQLSLVLADGGLEAHVQLAAKPATLSLSTPATGSCDLAIELGPGTWVAPLDLGADKLGRIQVGLRAGDRYDGTIVASADCLPDAALQALLPGAVAHALSEALGDALTAELVPALGLDLALAWSTPVAADALGTGFLRASVRARDASLLSVDSDRLLVGFSVGFEAEPHPCMAPLALPAPDSGEPPPLPRDPSAAAGAALAVRLDALQQALQAAWVAGMACADHATTALGLVTADELAGAWPALGRYAADARVRLELWPEGLPTIDPGDDGGLRVVTGRVVAEVWVEDDGAWWRAATATVTLAVEGALTATPDGFLWLDPSRVESWPAEVQSGLVAAPDAGALEAVLTPLVEGLVTARPLMRLPPSVRPAQARALTIGPEHAVLWR
ncbi:MAG: hypothetical protein U1F43_23365 [Myxococcota bacterium]